MWLSCLLRFFPIFWDLCFDSGGFSHTYSYNQDGIVHFSFKRSQVDFPNKYVLQSLNIEFIMIANSAYPDEMQHYQH